MGDVDAAALAIVSAIRDALSLQKDLIKLGTRARVDIDLSIKITVDDHEGGVDVNIKAETQKVNEKEQP